MTASPVEPPRRKRVALLPWGLVLEDFLELAGISVDDFCERVVGGWLFGYASALDSAGVDTVVVCFSLAVRRPERRIHQSTGATIVLLPASRLVRVLRPRMAIYGRGRGSSPAARAATALRALAAYSATPPFRLASVLRRERCDAVLVQEYEFPRFDVAALVGRLLRRPVVGIFQGGDRQRWVGERLIRPWSIRGASALVVAPEAERARVRDRYGAVVVTIPNPVDLTRWRPRPQGPSRALLGMHDSDPVVVWHGRVSVHKKGLDLLAEAWGQVLASWGAEPGTPRLLLVGDGADADSLAELLAGLGGITWRREFVYDPDVIAELLAAGDVYVFPSRHEGFPVAVAEALACGLPVVGAAASGVEDMVGTGSDAAGIVVAREDPSALAAALCELLRDRGRARRLGVEARRRADAWSWNSVGRQLRSLLFDQADERGR